MKEPFDWGDTVRIMGPQDLGRVGSVCGFRIVDTDLLARQFGTNLGDWLVLVEFGDGSSKELPASRLERVEEEGYTE